MKKLVSASEIEEAVKMGQKTIYVDNNTIITPAAKDLARELGVDFATDFAVVEKHDCKDIDLQKKDCREAEIDADVIFQVVKAVLSSKLLANAPAPSSAPPFLTDFEPKSGLKIVRGRSVKYEPFDIGDPSVNVAYREVISKNDSQMSAGFLTIEKSSFEWELCDEEIEVVLEGSLSITINGETYHACQGDILFVPKGSKVTWSSAGYVKLFYATYPASGAAFMTQR